MLPPYFANGSHHLPQQVRSNESYFYTVTFITSAKSRRILLIEVCSVRSSETIVQMNVFASLQLPKLSLEKQIILLFLFIAFD